jgi:hypothetical protein
MFVVHDLAVAASKHPLSNLQSYFDPPGTQLGVDGGYIDAAFVSI